MNTTRGTRFSFRFDGGQWKAYAVGLAILAVSVVAAIGASRSGRARNEAAFRARAATLSVAIREALDGPSESVRTIPPYFAASGSVEPVEFQTFVAPMFALFPSIVRAGFAPRISADERDATRALAVANGFRDFDVRERYADGTVGPSRPRPDHLTLLYCEPNCGADTGLDVSTLGPAAARALRTNSLTVASGSSVTPDDEHTEPTGRITSYAPFERAGRDPDLRIPRSGVALIEVDVARAIAPVVARIPSNMPFAIVDETADGALIVGDERARPGRESPEFVGYAERFEIQDHAFSIRFVVPADSLAATTTSGILVGAGTLLAIAATLTLLFAAHARRLRAKVREATQLGPYRLIRKVGEGGMGTVFEAEHRLLRRPTAVKTISDASQTRESLERFEREAKITSQLTHPNTVVVFDFGRTASGVFYYAMEYLRGVTLDELVRGEGALVPARVGHVLAQIAGSLAEAHAIGFVHRDVKPANVMLCSRGGLADFVKVLDFGLVKDVHAVKSDGLSIVGQTLGTPRYMAPEVFVDGEPPTPAADVYAVGAIGYYLLTGKELIQGSTFGAILTHHARGVVVPPSALRTDGEPIPTALEVLILRCLDKDPRRRPKDARELREDLADCRLPVWSERDAAKAFESIVHAPDRSGDDMCSDDTLALDDASRLRMSLEPRGDGRAA